MLLLPRALIYVLALPSAAIADCMAGQEVFLSCKIAERDTVLDVCFDATTAVYSYGPQGKPELTLQEPVASLDYLPWPGAGRAIWEEVTFYSGPYAYIVSGGFDRPMTDEEAGLPLRHFGGVTVKKHQTVIAALSCDPITVDFAWGEGLWTAKENLGQTWNSYDRRWYDLPD